MTISQYHKLNPHVWKWFKFFTFQMIRSGHKKLGSKMIFERIRWESKISGKNFKVNNNYTAHYSRLFERTYPKYKNFFEKRPIRKTL